MKATTRKCEMYEGSAMCQAALWTNTNRGDFSVNIGVEYPECFRTKQQAEFFLSSRGFKKI